MCFFQFKENIYPFLPMSWKDNLIKISKTQVFHSSNTLILISTNSTCMTKVSGFLFMVCIVYSLTNLKELKTCEAHLSFLSPMNSLNDLSCTRTCDPSLQRLRSCDFIMLESQNDAVAAFKNIHTSMFPCCRDVA